MEKEKELFILWTTGDAFTAEKMVFMYAINSKLQNWWDEVTLIIWGASTKLVEQNHRMQKLIKKAMEAGVKVTACQACADELESSDKLKELGVELKYWGKPLTELLQSNKKMITI